MAELPTPIMYDPKRHAHLLPQLAQIHADCVIEDGTMATFLPRADGSMDMAKLLAYWQGRAAQVAAGTLDLALQLAQDVAVTAEQGTAEEVLGYACLHMPSSETGPFRSVVEKLMVSPRHRRKGVARRVMAALEEVARRKQRGLIVSSQEFLCAPEKGFDAPKADPNAINRRWILPSDLAPNMCTHDWATNLSASFPGMEYIH